MLNAHIPNALRAGMGKHQVERLQKLEKAALAVSRFHGDRYGTEQVFRDKVFAPALAGSDSDAWAYEATEAAVRLRLLASLPQGLDADTVQASLKLALAGKELKTPAPPEPAPPPPHSAPLDQYDLLGGDGKLDKPAATQTPEYVNDGGIRIESRGGSMSWGDSLDDDGHEDWMPHVPQRKDVVIEGSGRWLERLKQLRERNYKLAAKLSNLYVPNGSNALAEINVGYGFIPIQLYNPAFLVQLQRKSESDADALLALNHTASIWWFLAEIGGMFPSDFNGDRYTCPSHILDQYVDASEDNPLYDKDMMDALNPYVPPHNRLMVWWLKLHDSHFDITVELVRNVRSINDIVLTHAADAGNATAWEINT
jgi:hypothetical protein